MKCTLWKWPVVLALGIQAPLLLPAQEQDDQEAVTADPVIYMDAHAERALWRMGEFLKSAGAFRVHAETTLDERHSSGQWVEVSRATDLSVHRERGIRGSMRGDLENREYWCDLETASLLDPDNNVFAAIDVPDTMDATLDFLLDEYGVSWPLADFVYSNPFVILIEEVQIGTYVGLHQVAGTPCHHLAFRQEGIDWQIWVDAGQDPVPRKISLTYRDLEGAPRVTAVLSDWDFAPHLPESIFAFEPPEGAEQIEFQSVRGK